MTVLQQEPIIGEMLRSGFATHPDGRRVPNGAGMQPEFADALYRTVRDRKPGLVIEVGMAHGVSTLAILAGLRDGGCGGEARLISIDPFQSTDFFGIGAANVASAGFGDLHELMEMPDYLALPELLARGTKAEFIYIDGWHTFDYTLMDFWYADKLLAPGGVVAFNDCHLRSVHRALKFVVSHRHYREIEVGLPPDFGTSLLGAGVRRLTGRNGADRYFEKLDAWEPAWDFYRRF